MCRRKTRLDSRSLSLARLPPFIALPGDGGPQEKHSLLAAGGGFAKPSSMNRKNLLLIALGSLLCGLLSAWAAEFPDSWTWDDKPEQRAAHAALEGKPMPAFRVTDWLNGGITAADIKGKVIVVDLYATWCGPCMQAIPHNNELLKRYKDKGLVIIGVCTSNSGQEKFQANAMQHYIQYPAARDPELKTEKAWGYAIIRPTPSSTAKASSAWLGCCPLASRPSSRSCWLSRHHKARAGPENRLPRPVRKRCYCRQRRTYRPCLVGRICIGSQHNVAKVLSRVGQNVTQQAAAPSLPTITRENH